MQLKLRQQKGKGEELQAREARAGQWGARRGPSIRPALLLTCLARPKHRKQVAQSAARPVLAFWQTETEHSTHTQPGRL